MNSSKYKVKIKSKKIQKKTIFNIKKKRCGENETRVYYVNEMEGRTPASLKPSRCGLHLAASSALWGPRDMHGPASSPVIPNGLPLLPRVLLSLPSQMTESILNGKV